MGIQPTQWVYDQSKTVGVTRFVLVAVAWYADNDTWTAWPSVDELARITRMSRSTVKRGIAAAQDLDELEIIRGRGRGNSNTYRLNPKGVHSEPLNNPKTVHSEPPSDHVRGSKRVQERAENGSLVSHRTVKNQEPYKRVPPEPQKNEPQQQHPQPTEPTRCTRCQHLTWDCLCNAGPLIRTALSAREEKGSSG